MKKESVCGLCKQPYRGKTLCPHRTEEIWETEFDKFGGNIPLDWIKKEIKSFINMVVYKSLLSSERQRLKERIGGMKTCDCKGGGYCDLCTHSIGTKNQHIEELLKLLEE